MFRKAFSFGGLLLLAGATALLTPGLSQARGGGHGGGGFHGGGPSGGGFHGGHVGGFRGGFHHDSFHHFGGYGYHPYYGGYTYDPYAYGSGGAAYESGYDGSYGDGTPYYSGDSSSLTPPALDHQSDFAPAADTSAHVTLTVPPGARVSFGGKPTTSAGPVREYISPALTPGKQYTYEVQARWNDNGQEVIQTQQVEVSAGADVNVAFPSPSAQRGRGTHE